MKKKAIICDLDGTLINIEHRRHFVEGEKKDWKSFLSPEQLLKDTTNKWCLYLILSMSHNVSILFVTGRSEEIRKETRDFIINNTPIDYSRIFMRKKGDYRQDAVIKEEIYKQYIEPNYDVVFCVDDRQQVVDMWRRVGLVCLQCDKGDF